LGRYECIQNEITVLVLLIQLKIRLVARLSPAVSYQVYLMNSRCATWTRRWSELMQDRPTPSFNGL